MDIACCSGSPDRFFFLLSWAKICSLQSASHYAQIPGTAVPELVLHHTPKVTASAKEVTWGRRF